ncbi:MAG: hypothetical protein KKC79_18600, partial [Gammaproteobacteria bacterium]|nr:hypothetical protein [Gammaproteobacteria bacterium]
MAIDEPVVTLNLRAGCATKSIRNYVLLSDVQVGPSLPAVAASGEPQRAPVPASRPVAPSSAESG